jgi:hypothetical protein
VSENSRYHATVNRFRRIIFNAPALLSLLLFVATISLWARTHAGPQIDFFVVIAADRSYGLGTERGALIGFLQQERATYHNNDTDDVQFRKLGFRYLRITSQGMRRHNLVLPLWLLTGIAAMLPLYWLARRLASSRQRRRGFCLVCSYDLRATPDRCPECGTLPGTLPAVTRA